MSGMCQADVALLIVPANKGGFETSIAKGNHKKGLIQGQTRQHARLCHLFGIEQIIVCINKMDDKSVNYSQDRYDEIKSEVSKMLTKIGYKTKKIPFIPMSGWKGDNLVKPSTNMAWYKGFSVKIKKEIIEGVTLIDALEKVIKEPKRPNNKQFIMPISGVYKIKGVGDVITGRIEQGTIKSGVNVKFYPSGCSANVVSIEIHHETVGSAQSGDNVGINIKRSTSDNRPKVGDVMTMDHNNNRMDLVVTGFLRQNFLKCYEYLDPTALIKIISDLLGDIFSLKKAKEFTALVFVQDHPGSLLCGRQDKDLKTGKLVYKGGFTPSIHVRTARAPCQMIKINWKSGKRTGNQKVEDVPYIEAGDQAEVVFKPKLPLMVKPFDECKPLGRIAAMDSNSLIMLGKVINVEYDEDDT